MLEEIAELTAAVTSPIEWVNLWHLATSASGVFYVSLNLSTFAFFIYFFGLLRSRFASLFRWTQSRWMHLTLTVCSVGTATIIHESERRTRFLVQHPHQNHPGRVLVGSPQAHMSTNLSVNKDNLCSRWSVHLCHTSWDISSDTFLPLTKLHLHPVCKDDKHCKHWLKGFKLV